MDNATWRQKLSYYTLFLPVRFYLLLFAAGIGVGYWWVNSQKTGGDNAYNLVLALLLKVAAWFIGAILILSFLSVLIPFVIFWWNRRTKKVAVSLNNTHKDTREQSLQRMEMNIGPVLRPPFGFLFYRFLYDENKLSPKFSLAPNKPALHFYQPMKNGWYNWPLPTIREYDVDKLVVYFEDIFQFFSFSLPVKVNQSFFTKPRVRDTEATELSPKKTEAESIRIEELRKVQGEYLNYKNFEDSDDVRRIVWKIYAKNKELVVRTQEIFDPFASHTYFYCSFYDAIGVDDAKMMQTRGLNYFKNVSWSIYQQLAKKGAEMRFIPDQDIPAKHTGNTAELAEYSVAVSRWQDQNPLVNYLDPRHASVLCISSLADTESLPQVLEQAGPATTVVFVKLTNSLRRPAITTWTAWLRWIFLQEEKNADSTARIRWRWSSIRRRIRQNEKNIETILKKAEGRVVQV